MKKHFTKTVLLAFCLFLSFSAKAETFVSGNISYSIISETELTVSVVSSKNEPYAGAINIPSSVNYNNKDYTVTAINGWAFSDCISLTSITIGNSVATIGEGAFYACSDMTSITIGNSVTTIRENAFNGCSGLTSIAIPNSVTSVGAVAFAGCSSLTKFIVSKDNASYCDIDGVLFTKDKTVLCAYPNSKGSEYSIPNSITTIMKGAFYRCSSLTSITIPNSVTAIEELAFAGCYGLTKFIVSKDNATYCDIDGVLFTKDKTELCAYPNSKDSEYSIPNSVTTIMKGAFYGCSGLTSITIPNSVTTIEGRAFTDCSGLTSITIGNSVTTIGEYAFHSCSGLTKITIPNSVITIGHWAYGNCNRLTSITIPNSVTTIESQAFYRCSGLTSITIGNSVTTIGREAFSFCSALTTINSLNPIAPILGEHAFDYIVYAENATLNITKGALSSYREAEGWKEFVKINEAFSGVEGVISDAVKVVANGGDINVIGAEENTPIEVYTLNGQLVYSGTSATIHIQAAGLYIARIAEKSYKVIITK